MRIEHIIEIKATVEKVWDVTADIETWPEWTPTMDSVKKLSDAPLTVGSKALIKQPRMKATEWTVTLFQPTRQFAWEAKILGVPSLASHEIFEEKGQTYNRLRFEMFGLGAKLLGPLLKGTLLKALRDENQGLKAYCENKD